MRILFVHQNFPGQFKHLAPALAAQGHQVVALAMQKGEPTHWQGVRVLRYWPERSSTPGIHPWVIDFETKTVRAEAAFRAALQLKKQGFVPDAIVAHPGWGESLFLKEVWPTARLGIYCEFFYHPSGADTGFDPEFPSNDVGEPCRLRLKNLNNLLHFQVADAGLSPTHWQASTFPEPFRERITVIHDGIDTAKLRPAKDVVLTLRPGLTLRSGDEVITFVNRNLEPYRGYHIFMRALPELLRKRPQAQVVLVGGSAVSYGAAAPAGTSWKDIFWNEVLPKLDDSARSRVHFVGTLDYAPFVALLQISTVHVYWTYPFVLSWSLLESMSLGCAIVASRTAPLLEVIEHGVTGRLVDFFDVQGLVNEVVALLDNPAERQRLSGAARQFAVQHYDLQSVCLPAQIGWARQHLGLDTHNNGKVP